MLHRYWRAVFSEFFSEKDKRNFDLLLEKASRPEGFFGDKDECLVILSAIEEVLRQIQRRQPNFKVPVEQIQGCRVACVNAFAAYCDAERSIRFAEEKCVRNLLDNDWRAMLQLCGIISDYYEVPYDFDCDRTNQSVTEFEIRRIINILYPAVKTFEGLFKNIYEAIKNGKPINSFIKKLAPSLLAFIPSLGFPGEVQTYPFFNPKALEEFFICSQNRQCIEIGIKQVENFHTKLDEILSVMCLPRKKSLNCESMICD